jgi:hypothetical protein
MRVDGADKVLLLEGDLLACRHPVGPVVADGIPSDGPLFRRMLVCAPRLEGRC